MFLLTPEKRRNAGVGEVGRGDSSYPKTRFRRSEQEGIGRWRARSEMMSGILLFPAREFSEEDGDRVPDEFDQAHLRLGIRPNNIRSREEGSGTRNPVGSRMSPEYSLAGVRPSRCHTFTAVRRDTPGEVP